MSTETRVTNVQTGGEKGSKIEQYALIPVEPLRQLAEMYGRGAQKYASRNWERGYAWSLSYSALQRHANAFWGGEDVIPQTPEGVDDDPTAGVHHLVAVAWHAFAMLEWTRTHPELDDRPSTVQAPPDELLSPVDEYQPLDASEITEAWGRAGEGEPDTRASVITEKLLRDAYDKLENPQRLPKCNHCGRLIATLGSHAKDCVIVAGMPIPGPPPGPERDDWKRRTFAEHYGFQGLDVILDPYCPKGKVFIMNPDEVVFEPDFSPDSSIWDTSEPDEVDLVEAWIDRAMSWLRRKLGR